MWTDALLSAFDYLISVIPPTVIGIVLMELLIELGLIQKLSKLTSPFMCFAHLREEVGISFLVSFGSPTAGNSMVAELNNKGLIDQRETIISSLINSFPSTFVIMRSMIPVLVILLGTIGLIYLGIVAAVGFLRTVITLVIGHFLLPPKKPAMLMHEGRKKQLKRAFMDALSASLAPLKRIIPTIVIASVIAFLLIDY
jgi:hypothetical protein